VPLLASEGKGTEGLKTFFCRRIFVFGEEFCFFSQNINNFLVNFEGQLHRWSSSEQRLTFIIEESDSIGRRSWNIGFYSRRMAILSIALENGELASRAALKLISA